ncbi:hypothetical protein PIB30_092121, partial [Stylosanthes scabra]|nr:hypothetical protein [Stylosanthes scabra]
MKRSQEGRNVASRLHKQLEKLPTQQGMLHKQPASTSKSCPHNKECCTSNLLAPAEVVHATSNVATQPASASSIACVTIDDAHASCSRISPKLKARS